MTYKSETPAGSHVAGVSWKSLDRTSTKTGTPPTNGAQGLISKQVLCRSLSHVCHPRNRRAVSWLIIAGIVLGLN